MELQEVVLDKEVFHEELRILKMRVAKVEELQPRDTGELSRTKGQYTMVLVKDVETRSLKCNSRILKDVTRDFTSTEMIWQKNWRKTSMIGRSHQRHEQGLKSLETLKIY